MAKKKGLEVEPKLGNRVRDVVTGFEGVCASLHTYLHGCARVGIEPTTLSDKGEPIDPRVFDIHRVEVLEDTPVPMAPHVASAATAATAPPPGGPQDDHIRSSRA